MNFIIMNPHMFLYFLAALSLVSSNCTKKEFTENPSIDLFREYLRIDTRDSQKLDAAVEFWRRQAADVGLQFRVYKPAGKPICVLTWEGADPALPSVMLNSHMDVVPVIESEWSHPPFEAYMEENGDIFARGAQDTKDVSIQYLEAIRRLKQDDVILKRTLHITLMPDEETGGFEGMKPFLNTSDFKALNIGFALDEGMISKNNTVYATYQDRRPWQMNFTVYGEGGHGSQIINLSAMEKTAALINAIMAFRTEQKMVMNSKNATEGSYTSININMLEGGSAPNVIPTSLNVVVDMRLATYVTVAEADELVNSWMKAAGNGTKVHFIRRDDRSDATPTVDSNAAWVALRNAVEKMGYELEPIVCPATSDMLVVRNLGIPAFGFAFRMDTTGRVHGTNEYMNAEVFLEGIDLYEEVLKNVGNY